MSKLRSESSGKSGHSTDGSYSFVGDEKLNRCSCSSVKTGSDAKWWLDNHGIGKCFSIDQLNLLEEEVKKIGGDYVKGIVKETREDLLIEGYYTSHSQKDTTFSPDRPLKRFYSHTRSNHDSWLKEFESVNDDLRKASKDVDSSNCMDFEQSTKLFSDQDSHLSGLKNIEPWWQAAESRDLTSVTSQVSSQFVQNSGLSEVLTIHKEKSVGDCFNCFEEVNHKTANNEKKLSQTFHCTNSALMKDTKSSFSVKYSSGNLASTHVKKSEGESGLMDGLIQGSFETLSSSEDSSTMKLDTLDTSTGPIYGDLNRVELLEALCHSQTRARQAEKMAQEACGERERVIDLFFRQASYLFAYRQWLHMLQLEALCLQLRSENQLGSFNPPALLRNNRRRVAKKRPGKPKDHLSKYAVAFAIGLSLVGAGLLVGLTIGWVFPAF